MTKKLRGSYYKDEKSLLKIGERIREFRNKKDYTIESLSIACEVDASQIGRMELGKVNFSISFLIKVAKVLNVDPKELLP